MDKRASQEHESAQFSDITDLRIYHILKYFTSRLVSREIIYFRYVSQPGESVFALEGILADNVINILQLKNFHFRMLTSHYGKLFSSK